MLTDYSWDMTGYAPEYKPLLGEERITLVEAERIFQLQPEPLAMENAMQTIMENWEDWNPKRWEPKWNPDLSYANPLPLMFSAGSHPNEAWGEQGLETPTSMRSVDASCQAKIIESRYSKKE